MTCAAKAHRADQVAAQPDITPATYRTNLSNLICTGGVSGRGACGMARRSSKISIKVTRRGNKPREKEDRDKYLISKPYFPPLMITSPSERASPPLRRLHCLDSSSPDFQNLLCDIFCGEEYVQCVQNLEGENLAWLVDYLDNVCL